MYFTCIRSIHVKSDIDTVWNAISDKRFEQDFIPEISRISDVKNSIKKEYDDKTVLWENGSELDIKLTRKDLNVMIEKIQINLKENLNGVNVTFRVLYRKPLEKHFFKAHNAVKQLFSIKLHVLKGDLDSAELKLALQ